MMPLVLSALQLDFHTVIIKIQMAESKKLAFETGGHSLPQEPHHRTALFSRSQNYYFFF